MGSDREGEFEKNMGQLLKLLKKILTSHPQVGQMPELQSFLKGQGINLNLCFFTFLPMGPEDLDELEEIYDRYFTDGEKRHEDWSTDLSTSDIDFLRRNGIRF